MSLHPISPADYEHRVVQHLQCPLHLRRKVHMTRRVEECHESIAQRKDRLLRKDRDAPGALKREGIKKGITVVHTPHFL